MALSLYLVIFGVRYIDARKVVCKPDQIKKADRPQAMCCMYQWSHTLLPSLKAYYFPLYVYD
jgi:hypothetical protein